MCVTDSRFSALTRDILRSTVFCAHVLSLRVFSHSRARMAAAQQRRVTTTWATWNECLAFVLRFPDLNGGAILSMKRFNAPLEILAHSPNFAVRSHSHVSVSLSDRLGSDALRFMCFPIRTAYSRSSQLYIHLSDLTSLYF